MNPINQKAVGRKDKEKRTMDFRLFKLNCVKVTIQPVTIRGKK